MAETGSMVENLRDGLREAKQRSSSTEQRSFQATKGAARCWGELAKTHSGCTSGDIGETTSRLISTARGCRIA